MKSISLTLVSSVLMAVCLCVPAGGASDISVAAPMTTDLAGSSAESALPSVFRILCPKENSAGTGFLHKSGAVITCYHVISNCAPSDVFLLGLAGRADVTNIIQNADKDLALLFLDREIKAPVLALSTNDQNAIGSQISTWGFPSGYGGIAPLLSSGYLSGIDHAKGPTGKRIRRLVVNAAFNSGNSGGPLVDIENNAVIGVVASKLAPLPPDIEKALSALKSQTYGFEFTRTSADGKQEKLSEAQVIEEVLQYLRSQTQLVIGQAVPLGDLRAFLIANGIEP